MIHSVLPSDIELATRLREAGHPDDEVVAILLRRGIAQAAADQLMDDLRNGRRIETQIPAGLEIAPRRRSREKRGRPGPPRESSRPDAPLEQEQPEEQSAQPQGKKSKFRFWPWVIVILLAVGAAVP